MSKAENGGEEKPVLVEIKDGLFVFENLQRNPSEEARRLIEEIEEGAERIREERARGLIIASQSHSIRV